tara:strand:+ start:5537 stop:6475 length:939 start_codon:yes stop_codon:yes gene_type:complete
MKELRAEKLEDYKEPKDFKVDSTLKNIMKGFQNTRNKKVEEYNKKLENQKITKERFIELIETIRNIYEKAMVKGDSFEIWQNIKRSNGFSDNLCLVSTKGYESKTSNNEIVPFSLIGTDVNKPTEFNECYFYDIRYEPADPHNENYLVTPDELFSDLLIDINGIQLTIDELNINMPYLEKDFDRLVKEEVLDRFYKNRKKGYIKPDLETFEFIPDVEIKFTILDLKNLEREKNNLYFYLNDLIKDDDELFISDNLLILDKDKKSVSLITNFDTLKVDRKKEKIEEAIKEVFDIKISEKYLMNKKPSEKKRLK